MENAIHITGLKNLKYFRTEAYQRIYWGQEFCQNLIPRVEDTREALKFAKKKKVAVSFVTPFVTQRGLDKLVENFYCLKAQGTKYEIIVNDWGVLSVINQNFKGVFTLSLGRLLVRQHRDPSLAYVLEKQPPYAGKLKNGKIFIVTHKIPEKNYSNLIKASYVNSRLTQGFLLKYGISRAEFNYPVQGVDFSGIKLKKTIYTPFVNISTTRFCPMEDRRQKTYRLNLCHKECQIYYDILISRNQMIKMYKRGNTTFYLNPFKDSHGADRIVYQPELPF